jgi:hypothetical protein
MGALKGSISVRRYAVLDPLPPEPRKRFTKGARAHAFTPIDPKGEIDQSAGWVSILDGEDADLHPEKLFYVAAGGEQLRITLRIDVLKPPPSEVRRQVNARARVLEAKEGRPATRRERRALKDEVARELRRRTLPRARTVDCVWDLDGRRLYLWSHAKRVNETFVDLFAKSFAVRIDVEGPSRWARAIADHRALEKLQPTRELWAGWGGVRPLNSDAVEDE